MHTCMMPVAPNRLVNISSVLEYASVLIGVHQVKYMEVQTMDAVKILMVDDEERMRKLVKDFLIHQRIPCSRGGRRRAGY